MKYRSINYNVPGKFYVNESCDGCGLCFSIAPDLFSYTADKKFFYVSKQPENENELRIIQEAIEACPLKSIEQIG